MNKVLIIAYTYPPDSRSGTFRILHFANEMAANGKYKPFIITVDEKYYEDGVHLDHQLVKQLHKNVTVVRTKCFQLRDLFLSLKATFSRKSKDCSSFILNTQELFPKKCSLWQPFKDIVSDEILAFPDRQVGWLPFAVFAGVKTIRRENIDIIFATGSPWTSFCAGALIKLLTKRPLIIDYRDPWTDNPFLSRKTTTMFNKSSKLLESMIAKFADAIISNTYKFNELLREKYPRKKSLYTVHNGFSQKDIDSIPIDNTVHDENNFIFTYAGSLYGHRNIDNFLIAFKELITKRDYAHCFRLQLIGVDHNITSICENILGNKLVEKHCDISGRIPHEQCLKQQIKSNCLLVFQQGTINQIPRKIFEYMAIRKPILAIVDVEGETSKVIKNSSCGIVVDDSPDAIMRAIEKLYLNYEKYVERINKDNTYKNYEVKELTKQVEIILNTTINANKSNLCH